jgi:signal-transduction protein with cAMP-binding, CBS, and nucleotidyltransferase domain
MSALITVDKNATMFDAAQIMTRKGIKHLAIKSDADKIVGIISATDLAKYLKQKLSQYKYRNQQLGEELNIAEVPQSQSCCLIWGTIPMNNARCCCCYTTSL